MQKRKFRFKTEFFEINGIYNIPGLIIFSDFGYSFKTYCCKNCGEIFVVDDELLHIQSTYNDKVCPTCKDNLKNCLVNYPENIFYNGSILANNNFIDRLHFEETELVEVYELE